MKPDLYLQAIESKALAMDSRKLVNCFTKKLETLSEPGDFQFAALVTLDLEFIHCHVIPFHLE